ncbi:MAG TPA: Zn-binding domain-containing protein, partial [Phycisphaerae bacterium]|nr:Zn-binding domain-containing protein [Phycisphaerae bacterium]
MRRKLRDKGRVVFTNPDMLHAALLPQHARWAEFLANLRILVLDELHVYSGIFGAGAANLMRRLARVCAHYGSDPRIVACSATIANPRELAEGITGRTMALIDEDGSPRGRRTYIFWNPPQVRGGNWRSRRSANVEAHELMAALIQRGVATITFSKAKMTAEMIHRYVCDRLRETAPHLVKKVTPYRGGYLAAERREIEQRLFAGELLGVSATRALELGIDVGALDACILVGYPGTLASFLQQSGRAGRRDRDAVVFLIGLDTSINQYVMSHPEYLFGRAVEEAVIDPDNPFVITGHLRCATHEIALPAADADRFGAHAGMVLRVLQDNHKVRYLDGAWYHAASEVPQHEVSLRDYADKNVVIEDVDTGAVLGEVNRFDAPPILHPEAIYMHRGDTYRVLQLDLEKNIATVKREEVDYYTQPLGGTDVHHVDHRLREKPFGPGTVYWGEVTAYFRCEMYEKIHFYSLDAISRHGLDLPTFVLETMAVWIVPPEDLMERVRRAGLDAHSGLRGIGYATRMLLPLFITCDTLDFSHTVGAVNAPWNAIFIYERYPHGLGYTEKAYDRLHEILPAVLDNVRKCPCTDGCPVCVGKPLRQYTTWNVERGEGSIPSKASAVMILESLLADGTGLVHPDTHSLTDSQAGADERIERMLRRRLERMREPQVFHPIEPHVKTAPPRVESTETLDVPDVARRAQRRTDFQKELRRRLAKKIETG